MAIDSFCEGFPITERYFCTHAWDDGVCGAGCCWESDDYPGERCPDCGNATIEDIVANVEENYRDEVSGLRDNPEITREKWLGHYAGRLLMLRMRYGAPRPMMVVRGGGGLEPEWNAPFIAPI